MLVTTYGKPTHGWKDHMHEFLEVQLHCGGAKFTTAR